MSDLIIRAKPPKLCGNCEFGQPIVGDLRAVICCGAPPVPIAVPKMTASGPQMFMESARPNMPKEARACALWAERETPKPPEAA